MANDGNRPTRLEKTVNKLAESEEALLDIKTRVGSTAAQTPVNETIVSILGGMVEKARKKIDEFHPTPESKK